MAQRKGFTLVELLVVVAIIVVLIAILTPAMEKAMGVAQAAVCMSNQHAIKVALVYYMDSYQRVYPYGLKGPASSAYYPDPPNTPTGHYQDGAKPPQQLLFTHSVNAHKVFVCPTDTNPLAYGWWWFYDAPDFRVPEGSRPGEVRDPATNTGLGVRDPTGGTLAANEKIPSYTVEGSSYMFSEQGILGVPMSEHIPFRNADIVSPSKYGYMSDGNSCPSGWGWWNIDRPTMGNNTRITWSHPNKTVNMLFGDGSVARTDMKGAGVLVRRDPLYDSTDWRNDKPSWYNP